MKQAAKFLRCNGGAYRPPTASSTYTGPTPQSATARPPLPTKGVSFTRVLSSMPKPRNQYGDSSYYPQVAPNPPSPTSSFEEVPHPSTWNQHALEEDTIPLPHYMSEDKARRRNVAPGPEKPGWAGSSTGDYEPGYPPAPEYGPGEYENENEKGTHGKPRLGYGPGRLGPMRPRRPPPPTTDWVRPHCYTIYVVI